MLQLFCGPLGDDDCEDDIVYNIVYDIAYVILLIYDIDILYDIV